MKEKDLTKKVLEEVANELSEVMDFETSIKTGKKITIKQLKDDLIEAAKELRKEDEISDKAKEVLELLGVDLPFEEVVEEEKEKNEKENPKKKTSVKITKKSIIIDILKSKNGGTIENMAKLCTKAGLGDLDQNIKTCKLWLRKIGFAIEENNGIFKAK